MGQQRIALVRRDRVLRAGCHRRGCDSATTIRRTTIPNWEQIQQIENYKNRCPGNSRKIISRCISGEGWWDSPRFTSIILSVVVKGEMSEGQWENLPMIIMMDIAVHENVRQNSDLNVSSPSFWEVRPNHGHT